MATNVRHLKRGDIDIDKWNGCIDEAPTGLVYAYSWYLDAMCDHWDALVLDDYAAVMPIPWRQKWRIKYVYTPAFVQQLGIISKVETGAAKEFVAQLYSIFRYGSYNFNFGNERTGIARTNFVLDLSPGHKSLAQAYTNDLKNNLKKASRSGLMYQNSTSFIHNLHLFQTHYADRLQGVEAEDFRKFQLLCANLDQSNKLVARHTTDTKGNIVSSALLLHVKNRLYLIMCTTTEVGRRLAAGHYLIDQIIQEFAGSNQVLDFEGSDLPGVFHFYQNFNPQNQPYCFHHWNHLPIPLRWLKK
jgi:hypothetical protein